MDARYPIGQFEWSGSASEEQRQEWLKQVAMLPSDLLQVAGGMTMEQLDTPYREGGWTVRQLIHHVADSHMNGLIRVKLALTEETPTIKPYDENAWALLADMKLPVSVSLGLIDSVHARWAAVYHAMTVEEFERAFVHPEIGAPLTLDWHLQQYAWHSHHHLAHITELRRTKGW